MFRHLAPTGSPIKLRELLLWFAKAVTMSGDEAQLKGAVQALLGNKYSSVYSTGRGAMTTLLSGVKALRSSADSRNEVIMPAYTCYSVASSAINAGLKIRLCDIDPTTLSFDQDKLQQIDFTNVIAIVSANLYGLPNNLVELERLADERGVMLIDDAAQSLNSRLAGRYVGTFGSAGILSLDKGKNATSIQGGLIITDHSDLSEAIVDIYKEVPDLGMKAGLVEFIKVLIYYLFLNPYAYKIPASISFSGLGETRFETDVEIKRYPSFLATLAESQLKRLDEITESRIAHGDFYETHITENKNIKKIKKCKSAQPVYLRYPLLVLDDGQRADLLAQYRQYGISASYPKALSQLTEIESNRTDRDACPGAELVAKSIVTLPTHAFVTEQDMQHIVKHVNEI